VKNPRTSEKRQKRSKSDRYFIVEPGTVSEGIAVLEGPEFHHCVRVSRVRPGDVVKLLDGRGCIYEARMRRIGADEALLDVISCRKEHELLPVDIALGIIKAPRFDLAVEKCTELGVRRLIPFASERSVWRGGAAEAGRAVARMRRVSGDSRGFYPHSCDGAPRPRHVLHERESLHGVAESSDQRSRLSSIAKTSRLSPST